MGRSEHGIAVEDVENRVGGVIRSAEAAQVESYLKAAEDRGWVEPVDSGDEVRLSKTGRALLSGIRARRSNLDDAGEGATGDLPAEAAASSRQPTPR